MTSVAGPDDWALQAYMRELVEQGEAADLAAAEFNAAMNSAQDIFNISIALLPTKSRSTDVLIAISAQKWKRGAGTVL